MINSNNEKQIGDFQYRDGVLALYTGKQTEVEIPEGTEIIGRNAFTGAGDSFCKNIENINIPAGVREIKDKAFCYCSSLININIPETLTYIGKWAFSDCKSLRAITFNGTTAQWNAIKKDIYWNDNTGEYTVYCLNGAVQKKLKK